MVLKLMLGTKGAVGSKVESLWKIDVLKGFWGKIEVSGLKMGFIGKIDVLKGFEEYKRGLLGKLSGRDKSGAFRENCPEGIEHQYSEWIEDQHSLKAPFFNPNIFFTQKNPSRKSIFPKSSIFDSNAPFLPNNLFKTSIFPKSPIFDPNALFLLQNINIP